MTALKKVKSYPGVVDYFKELPLYNKHIEKPKIKRLKNINLLSLSGSSYIKLPIELKCPKKGLINIKNNDQKCFS